MLRRNIVCATFLCLDSIWCSATFIGTPFTPRKSETTKSPAAARQLAICPLPRRSLKYQLAVRSSERNGRQKTKTRGAAKLVLNEVLLPDANTTNTTRSAVKLALSGSLAVVAVPFC